MKTNEQLRKEWDKWINSKEFIRLISKRKSIGDKETADWWIMQIDEIRRKLKSEEQNLSVLKWQWIGFAENACMNKFIQELEDQCNDLENAKIDHIPNDPRNVWNKALDQAIKKLEALQTEFQDKIDASMK
jgi:hypothetical protein